VVIQDSRDSKGARVLRLVMVDLSMVSFNSNPQCKVRLHLGDPNREVLVHSNRGVKLEVQGPHNRLLGQDTKHQSLAFINKSNNYIDKSQYLCSNVVIVFVSALINEYSMSINDILNISFTIQNVHLNVF
jgi:hypothetical protein